MSYTLEQFAADCRSALMKDPGSAGREQNAEEERRVGWLRGAVGVMWGHARHLLYPNCGRTGI